MYICKFGCKEKFGSVSLIRNHYRWKHKKIDILYKCECGKEFVEKCGYLSHKKFCNGNGIVRKKKVAIYFTCPKCNYIIKSNIKKHLKCCDGSGPRRFKKRLSKSEAKKKDWTKKEYRDKQTIKNNPNKTGKASTSEKEIERKRKLREIALKNGYGGYKRGSGRSKGCWYESKIAGRVYLDSSCELAYAKWLDKQNILWKKNHKKFPYTWENKIHYYIPDFYLIDKNEYIETKGFETEKDGYKWKEFPHKLTILKEKELKEMKIL
jgi:hypothetical protein